MHQVGGAVLGEDLGTRSAGRRGEYTHSAHTDFVKETYIKLAGSGNDVFDVLHDARGE
jgi:hypothetical protein